MTVILIAEPLTLDEIEVELGRLGPGLRCYQSRQGSLYRYEFRP